MSALIQLVDIQPEGDAMLIVNGVAIATGEKSNEWDISYDGMRDIAGNLAVALGSSVQLVEVNVKDLSGVDENTWGFEDVRAHLHKNAESTGESTKR